MLGLSERFTLPRLKNRLKRELLRLPPVHFFNERAHQSRVQQYAAHLQRVAVENPALVQALGEDGIYPTTMEALGNPLTAQVQKELLQLRDELAAVPLAPGANTSRLPHDRIYDFPAVTMWGLHPALLDMVEKHLRVPAWYLGADIRREVADGNATDVRQWHVDVEDRRLFKVIVYLNDVTPEGGPFEYVPRGPTLKAAKALGYRTGFIPDARLAAVLPRSEWRKATGPQWTAAVADTCNILHRASAPVSKDRYSVTYSWSSRHPGVLYPSTPMPAAARAHFERVLSARQRECLFPHG